MGEYLDGAKRRRQIAEVALELIGSEGISALKMRRLAKLVGLVPSGLYRHFQDKNQVLEAAFGVVADAVSELVIREQDEEADPISRLHVLLMSHIRLATDHPGVARLIFGSFAFSDDSRRRARVREVLERYLAGVAALVRRGQIERIFRDDIPAETVAVVFLGLVQAPVVFRHLRDGDFDTTDHARRAWGLFLDGLRRSSNGWNEP